MSEVKVKITAQNETQTGFQSVLSDAKKTASEVKKTFTQSASVPQPQQAAGGKPFSFDDFYNDAIAKAEQQIESNLAKRKQAREAAAQAEKAANADTEQSVMSLVGRFALLTTAAAAVGKAISMAFERVSDAFKSAAEASKQLGAAFEEAGTATSLEGAVSGFKQINAIADQIRKTREETFGKSRTESFANLFQGRPGQFMARAAETFLDPFGMGAFEDLKSQEQDARRRAREMLSGSLERRATGATELLAAGSDQEAIARVQREQQNRAEIESLRNALQNEDQAVIDSRVAQLQEIHRLEQQIEDTRRRASEIEKSGTRKGDVIGQQLGPGNFRGIEEMQREREAAARALGPEFGPGTAEAAAGGFRVDAAMFQQQQAEEAARAIMANQQNAFQGSDGASAFQRIGFASNEFFDTRQKKGDPAEETQKAARLVGQILQILRRGEPLVLPSSN